MDDSGAAYLAFSDLSGGGSGSMWVESLARQERQEQQEVEAFRRRLKYFFMNPCEKYHARGRKPWKLMLQIIKIAVITAQLVSFGLSNQMVVAFKEENLMAFKHLFLKDYASHDPGDYAVYTQAEVYTHLSHVVKQFLCLRNLTVGNHAYEKDGHFYAPLLVCQQFYHNGSISPANETFEIDAQVEKECLEIYPLQPVSVPDVNLSNFTLQFKRLLEVNVYFTLKAINLQTVQHHELPDCYDFSITITFDNRAHSGRIRVDLDNDVDINECRDWKVTGASPKNIYYTVLFDTVIILTCLASLVLCTRSVATGVQLQFDYTTFFKNHFGKRVSWSDRMEFINGWYILIVVSDVLTITGSVLKIAIQLKVVTSYDVCSILLGTGTMLVWIGVLRYMGYFKKYNILIITLRAAFPNVMRFCCCAAMIYLGYCFCGWIVLGPYHEKFRSLNTVCECLFSLINGDDMFTTFKTMQQKSYLVWLFGRVYLYTFVSLFIYMVLSLFITLITDTYETIKQQQVDTEPASELHAFVSECKDHPNSGCYRVDDGSSPCLVCCGRRLNCLHERH
ncbi:mucolipin-3 isoform X1 [Electrophorus electricus]|nr:mucolipin-3 isoform X1 [Electrophorus electricus]XP_026886471.2 mucolipin-3 isoform X1 [Electrophorus electricus]